MINIQKICKTFQHKDLVVEALKDVSLQLDKGKSLAICGSSGAGKSTLLNIMGGLDKPTAGKVYIDDLELTQCSETQEADFRNKNLGFIFQFHHLLYDFTVLENVMMPLLIAKQSQSQAKDKAMTVLQKVKIEDKKSRYPKELSGGEQQRAAIARALVHNPRYILADEPTGNLDEKNADLVFDLLCQLNHDLEATLLLVTHHDEFAKKLNHKIVLENGKVIEHV